MNTVNVNSILVPDSSKLWLPEEPFTGTFREFLPYAKENPFSVASAKATMWRLVIRQGINEERTARNLARFGTYIPVQRLQGVLRGGPPDPHLRRRLPGRCRQRR
jgi:hypothetical protein